MYSELLSLVRTKEEALRVTEQLETISEALYQNSPEALNLALSKKIDSELSRVLKEAFDKGVDKVKFLKGAKEIIGALREITLTIAFEPREETKTLLAGWVRENLGEGVALELKKDEKVVGGAIIISQGNYRDFSLRTKIKEFFKTQRNELAIFLK